MKILSGKMLIDQYGIERFREASTFGALADAAIRFLLEKGTVLGLEKDDRLFSLLKSNPKLGIVFKFGLTSTIPCC